MVDVRLCFGEMPYLYLQGRRIRALFCPQDKARYTTVITEIAG
jgi:hypothetical protein